jgi:hypothetical protein
MEIGGRSESEASKIVKAWIESGVLIKGDHYEPTSKHNVKKVDLDEAMITAMLTELQAPNVPEE